MKLCECGCGGEAPIATRTSAAQGYVKGQPRRFINGHQMRDGSLRFFYRIVMEAHLGRALTSDEIVHHRNGDPSDDRLENLQIVSRAGHMDLHRTEIEGGAA